MYNHFLRDIEWMQILVYWTLRETFSNISRVTPCSTSTTFSSHGNLLLPLCVAIFCRNLIRRSFSRKKMTRKRQVLFLFTSRKKTPKISAWRQQTSRRISFSNNAIAIATCAKNLLFFDYFVNTCFLRHFLTPA